MVTSRCLVVNPVNMRVLHSHSLCCVTEEMGKPGSDAGMPGIEDSEVGKIDDVQFGK